ncbi:MAG TPA: carbamoyltransferase C-terminal domain-containing protein [Bryobacteraceae bacterium]|nr:carbamoyltransferase C-terminal domain-containing protein [Bryobacteraceae bacterium]
MNIIGISGLETSVPFKKRHWPNLDEREYRISQGHDSAAALVVDGVCVAAAAEERFTRQKHTAGFPIHAIQYCMREAGLELSDIDEIAHGFDYSPYAKFYPAGTISAARYADVYSKAALLDLVRKHLPEYPEDRVIQVSHHQAHAASAACTSGWDECLTVVIDGMGEAESASAWLARGGSLDRLAWIPVHDSIGILYSLITLHLGFDFNSDEYKIMGLAPYGDPSRFRPFFEKTVQLQDDGTIRIPILALNRTPDERENYLTTRSYLGSELMEARDPDSEITDRHRDLAAGLQECLDRAFLHLCGSWGKRTGQRRLALAGGVALNCTANGHLMRSGLFDEIYIQPAAADDGSSLGAALYRAMLAGEVTNKRFPVPYLGPAYCQQDIDGALKSFGDSIEVEHFDSLEQTCAKAAGLMASGHVLAWYRDRMEFGPRALGNRSIIADPGRAEMRDRVNAMVKMREAFRPFAPAVSEEQVHQWFDVPPGTKLPYMIVTVDVRKPYRDQLPAITHVNGSARVQTVSATSNPAFHALLRAMGKATGREMVLNTSFNVKGQPIVNTPEEAVETFLRTGIDFLFVGNAMVSRREKCTN